MMNPEVTLVGRGRILTPLTDELRRMIRQSPSLQKWIQQQIDLEIQKVDQQQLQKDEQADQEQQQQGGINQHKEDAILPTEQRTYVAAVCGDPEVHQQNQRNNEQKIKQNQNQTQQTMQQTRNLENTTEMQGTEVREQIPHQHRNTEQTEGTGEGDLRQGRPVVKIPRAEWQKLANKEGKLTLIGKFARGRPNLELVRTALQALFPIKGSAHVGSLDAKHILMRFSCEEDCKRILSKGHGLIEDKMVRFSRWTPDWKSKGDSPMVSVWMELPGLPYHLFNAVSLAHICRPIGRLIVLDAATERRTRPSVAKVKIEIDFSKTVVDRIWIEIKGEGQEKEGFWQRIEVENPPKFCNFCTKLGHNLMECRRQKGMAPAAKVQWLRRQSLRWLRRQLLRW